MRYFLILILFSCSANTILLGQSTYGYIIKVNDILNAESYQDELGLATIQIKDLRLISHDLKLYSFQSENELSHHQISKLEGIDVVEKIYIDVPISLRVNPNDPLYMEQWAITLTKIEEVWEYTTGGLTQDGQQIVVAVLDDGYSIGHSDLQGVFLENDEEIPNNNLDDDNNGYIDDFVGLNLIGQGDNHPNKTHGTAVAGLIGAKGDNNIGISGVNWNVKILPLSNVNTVGRIIEAYDYILNMRKLYNDTNGAQGALIAFTSFSGGVDDKFGTSGIYLEWCNMYDLLGLEGVLNFGAATNRFVNVDEVGDMPSTCTSDYFIGVTGLNRGGQLNDQTAFGPVSIDIAAPSNGLIAPKINDEYADFNGTSAATPMVAGVAALLYSVPCTNFAALINGDRIASIELIRDVILEGVTESSEMQGLYVTGGYLNASNALRKMVNICEDSVLLIPSEVGALKILSINKIADRLQVFYRSPNGETHFLRWVDPSGRTLFYREFIPQDFGEKFALIEIPIAGTGKAYLSLGNQRNTVSKAFSIIE